MAKRITWWQVAEILRISDRHMRRWRERYEELAMTGCSTAGGGSLRRNEFRWRWWSRCWDSTATSISTWVKQALQGAGLVARVRKRGVHRQRRPRRPLPGMLLHIDGSRHRWFQDERRYDLIVLVDNPTSEIS